MKGNEGMSFQDMEATHNKYLVKEDRKIVSHNRNFVFVENREKLVLVNDQKRIENKPPCNKRLKFIYHIRYYKSDLPITT